MSLFGCRCKCGCLLASVIASVIVGIATAFLQITGTITVTPAFLWVVFGIAVGYLGVLLVTAVLTGGNERCQCFCAALNALLAGILGTVLLAVVLLAVGIVATSILSAILVGILLFFFALTLTGAACLIREITVCGC